MKQSLCYTVTSWVLRVVKLVKALQREKKKETQGVKTKPVHQRIKEKGDTKRK